MIELDPPPIQTDIASTSIEYCLARLSVHKPKEVRVFFIVFVKPYQIFEREYEKAMRHGFDRVFFVPKEELPNNDAWDIVMYSTETCRPIARQENRPIW